MKILGIETSCDETSISILEVDEKENLRILSNTISSQIKIHAKYGGVYPALAAREHAKNIDKVLKLTLREAGLKSVSEVDLIAVTKGPGLAVALIVGIHFAKTLAWKFKKPIAGVNHLEGQIYSNWLPPLIQARPVQVLPVLPVIPFPILNLIVSGGHTELVLMKKHGQYKIIGETLDDAAGEAFDKIARLLGLGYPGGPLISAEAEKWSNKSLSKSGIHPLENSRARSRGSRVGRIPDLPQIKLPRPMINSKDFDFSFSGLKTAALYLVKKLREESSKFDLKRVRPAIAHEAQQAIVDVLVSKTLKAAKQYKVKSVLLSGGVSANKLLRETLEEEITNLKGVNFFQPAMAYTTDNAAMIALASYFNYANKKPSFAKATEGKNFSWKSVELNPNLKF